MKEGSPSSAGEDDRPIEKGRKIETKGRVECNRMQETGDTHYRAKCFR